MKRMFDSSEMLPDGLARRVYRPLRPVVERLLRLERIRQVWRVASKESDGPVAFAEVCLRELGIAPRGEVQGEASLMGVGGPLLIVANHPFGGIEALELMRWIERIRPGNWRMVVNQFLWQIDELRPVMVKVDPAGPPRESVAGLVEARRFLGDGGCVVMFPAGRVSEWRDDLGGPCDLPWSEHAARLAKATKARVAVVHVAGQNRDGFMRIPPEWRGVRTLALVRALSRPPVKQVDLKVVALLNAKEVSVLSKSSDSGDRLRAICYAGSESGSLSSKQEQGREPRGTTSKASSPLHLPESPEFRLLEGQDFEVLRFRGDEAPELLEVIGRGREVTFRAAGQGVGKEIDLSPEDQWYHHLAVRDRRTGQLVGAYRLGVTQEILERRGPQGMYLGKVFEIKAGFYDQLGPSLELSRSFVLPTYQRDNRSLAMLWKGLGATSVELECRTLYGSVTISDAYEPITRAVLAAHLDREHGDDPSLRALVRARQPFIPSTKYHSLVTRAWAGDPVAALWPVATSFEGGSKPPPPLIKYYTSLGAKFLSFHVEEAFQNALYCLMRVDLERIPPSYRRRFLGR